jgi:hypothetical protein
MADLPRHPDTDEPLGAPLEPGSKSGSPWGLYAFAFLAIVVVLALVVLHLTGVIGPGAR